MDMTFDKFKSQNTTKEERDNEEKRLDSYLDQPDTELMSDKERHAHNLNLNKYTSFENEVIHDRQRHPEKYPVFWRPLKEEQVNELKERMTRLRLDKNHMDCDAHKDNHVKDRIEENKKQEKFEAKLEKFKQSQYQFEEDRQDCNNMLMHMQLMTKFMAKDRDDVDVNELREKLLENPDFHGFKAVENDDSYLRKVA